jgi:bifunctional DNA-binding transcriptional regulator/antitoxin component of YhaV-PrlF toxin-antitoxin module
MSDVRGMSRMQSVIRDRRQITLPREVCEQLGVDVGDTVEMAVEGGALVITPSKKLALDALNEIQAAFARSSISEQELQRAAGQARTERARERYGRRRSA